MSDLAFTSDGAPGGGKKASIEHPRGLLPHYVSGAPFDPYAAERMTPGQERFFMASQWRMMWWKLKRHRLAVISGAVLMVLYGSILISEFLAPYALNSRHDDFIFAPPQHIHLFQDGRFVGPYVLGYDYRLDMKTLKRVYTPNPAKVEPSGYPRLVYPGLSVCSILSCSGVSLGLEVRSILLDSDCTI